MMVLVMNAAAGQLLLKIYDEEKTANGCSSPIFASGGRPTEQQTHHSHTVTLDCSHERRVVKLANNAL